MCKKNTDQAQENSATNVGLVNFSSESFDSFSVEIVVELIGLTILLFMLMRWLKKCVVKRREKHRRQLQSILNGGNNHPNHPNHPNPFVNPPVPSAPAASPPIPLVALPQLGGARAMVFENPGPRQPLSIEFAPGKTASQEIWTQQ